MAEVDVDAELDAIEHLDFRPECESKSCNGPAPAEFVVVLMSPCCGLRVPRYVCAPCLQVALDQYKVPRDVRHRPCGRMLFGVVVADHLAVLPIGGPR